MTSLLWSGLVVSRPDTGDPRREVPCGAKRARTADPLLAKQVLYQLSYSPKRHPGYPLPEQGGQFGDGLDQVGGAGGLEAGRFAVAGDADQGPGAGPAAAGDDVLAVADDRDRGDVLDAETEDRGEHQVRPGKAVRDVVQAEGEVSETADAQALEHQPRGGPGEPGDEADLEQGGGQRDQRVPGPGHGGQPEPFHDRPERTFEGQVGRLRLGVVVG